MTHKISEQVMYVGISEDKEGKQYLQAGYLIPSGLERQVEIKAVKKEIVNSTDPGFKQNFVDMNFVDMYRIQYINGALQVEQIDLDLIR